MAQGFPDFGGGPVALAYDRFSEGVKTELRKEYLASIECCRKADGYAVGGELVVVAAMR